MSVVIKISYEYDHELTQIVDRLSGLNLRLSTPAQVGQYKRAYLKDKPVKRDLNGLKPLPKIETEFPID